MGGNGANASADDRKVCFVVMGYGKKTAYTDDHKPRVLDLDATFETIIEPAVTGANLRCVRSDKMLNSGMIDTRMYEMLLRADLVVADISTGNVNAVYELGVRHALRPHSTILMQEDQAAFHFDLSHISTFTYEHLGKDIGGREAADKKEKLQALIESVMANPTRDSPVYEFLTGLDEPTMSEEDYERMLTVIEERGDGLQQLLAKAKAKKAAKGGMPEAAAAFEQALAIIDGKTGSEDDDAVGQSDRDYVVQQLALTTYKSEVPSKREALERGLKIIAELHPETSNDTETLGIAGAIEQRLWEITADRAQLDRAIEYYGRGFQVKRDYYNGENYATNLVIRAGLQDDEDEAVYDRMTAKKTRKEIIEGLERDFAAEGVDDRGDLEWMHATMANCLFALGREDEALQHEETFKKLADGEEWKLETYEGGKAAVLAEQT